MNESNYHEANTRFSCTRQSWLHTILSIYELEYYRNYDHSSCNTQKKSHVNKWINKSHILNYIAPMLLHWSTCLAKQRKMTAKLLYLLVTTLVSIYHSCPAIVLETGPFPHIFAHFQMSSWKPRDSGCKSQEKLVAYSFWRLDSNAVV